MPRPKSLSPSVEVKAYLTQENAARLALLSHSDTLGKKVFGSTSRIINEALAAYFAALDARKDPNVQR